MKTWTSSNLKSVCGREKQHWLPDGIREHYAKHNNESWLYFALEYDLIGGAEESTLENLQYLIKRVVFRNGIYGCRVDVLTHPEDNVASQQLSVDDVKFSKDTSLREYEAIKARQIPH
ncbi:hypothetical protein Tco_0780392 [Tanacetum coccineum]